MTILFWVEYHRTQTGFFEPHRNRTSRSGRWSRQTRNINPPWQQLELWCLLTVRRCLCNPLSVCSAGESYQHRKPARRDSASWALRHQLRCLTVNH